MLKFFSQVDDTNEVQEAKVNFYQLYEEAKKKAAVEEEEPAQEESTTASGAEDVEVVRTKREEGEEADKEETAEVETATDNIAAENSEVTETKAAPVKPSGNYFYFNTGSIAPKKSQGKLVYHPYYGYIPVAAPKQGEKAMEPEAPVVAKQTYVFRPYQGYVPVAPKKEGEEAVESTEQTFEYHPYFGFVPVTAKKMEAPVMEKAAEAKKEMFVFHPYLGFMPLSQLKEADKAMYENKQFYFDPYYGFMPVPAKKAEEVMEEEEKVEQVIEKAAEAMVEEVAQEMEKVEEIAEEMKAEEVEKKEETKFYFHPYYGFIPVEKLTDEKMMRQVNMEMKYVLHPYYGFIPESKLKAMMPAQQKIAPYNPFGFKFLPYQPTVVAKKPYYYTYNPVGEQMKAMTEKVEAVPEEAEMKREKRSTVNTVVPAYQPLAYQFPASTFPLYSNPIVASTPQVLLKSNAEPDTKTLLEEQPQMPVYGVPVTQIRPTFINQPYYYAPYQITVSAKAEADNAQLPVLPQGANVAQNPLPENSFPIFPYDPAQDQPAAEAF